MANEIPIPFMGDTDISNDTKGTSIASWVDPVDQVPLLLALSLYGTPRLWLDNYQILVDKGRVVSWINYENNSIIIGLKGTSDQSLVKDVADDLIIMTDSSYCDLSLVREGEAVITETLKRLQETPQDLVEGRSVSDATPTLTFAGHSLGGTAAMCLTDLYPNSTGVSFNGGAAPTNPILKGPGPDRFTHYHIVGDLVSSHMSEAAAKVVRVKIPGKDFGSQAPHSSGNLLLEGSVYSADMEDKEYTRWGLLPNFVYSIVSKLVFIGSKYRTQLKVLQTVEKSPIPNSTRSFINR